MRVNLGTVYTRNHEYVIMFSQGLRKNVIAVATVITFFHEIILFLN